MDHFLLLLLLLRIGRGARRVAMGERDSMSLQQFLHENRLELIKRTRAKVAARPSPQPSEAEMELGVPLFLSQLTAALEDEGRAPAHKAGTMSTAPHGENGNIAESATVHGQSLHKFGFTIEQVVHDYGDVCQAVTELADEQDAMLTNGEFHTLNRCLDNAIAGAVTSWNTARDKSLAKGTERKELSRLELLNLVCTATVSFDALHAGRVGISGATAAILRKCLVEMRALLDKDG
jgi:hypothetical protein